MSNNNSNWIQRIQEIDIPIMKHSRDFIQQHKDSPGITISRIQKNIRFDPGLTLRFLIEAGKSKSTHVTSLSHAMLMLGMPRVLSYTKDLPVLEESVTGDVLTLVMNTYHRHFFLARLARHWAEQRSETELEEIFTAALVRNSVEWLLCLLDPALAQQSVQLSRQHSISITEALEKSFHCNQQELSHALAKQWNLPERVSLSLAKDKTEQCLWIEQAACIASCAETGWFHKHTTNQLQRSAEALHKKADVFVQDVHRCCVSSSRDSFAIHTPTPPLAAELVRLPGLKYLLQNRKTRQTSTAIKQQTKTARDILKHSLAELSNNPALGYQELISHCFKALNEGLGLERVFLSLLTTDKKSMKVRFANVPDDIDAPLKQLTIPLDNKNLFQRIVTKPAIVWCRDENSSKYTKLLPADFYHIMKSRHFLMMSLFVDHKPIGVIYTDRKQGGTLELQHHKYFKHVCQSLEQALQGLSDRNHKKHAS